MGWCAVSRALPEYNGTTDHLSRSAPCAVGPVAWPTVDTATRLRDPRRYRKTGSPPGCPCSLPAGMADLFSFPRCRKDPASRLQSGSRPHSGLLQRREIWQNTPRARAEAEGLQSAAVRSLLVSDAV